jgi:DNA-binding response OmpR family regulator
MRVLIVEDEWLIAVALEGMVSDLGHEVIGPANDVARALELVSSRTVDAALLDVALGTETSFPIAEMLEAHKLPFAFLTGYTTAELPLQYCARAVLAKPVSSDRLQNCLSSFASESETRSVRRKMR